MKVDTAPFAKAIEIAAMVVEKRNTIPILGNVMIEAHEGDPHIVRAYGTDLDMQVMACARTGSGSRKPFTIAAPIGFARFLRSGGEETEIRDRADKTGQILISSGDISATIKPLPAEDFPQFNYDTRGYFNATLGFESIDAILRVSAAMSKEETRYYLNGVYLHHVKDWSYMAVATDGHRLFMHPLELPDAEGLGITENSSGGGVIIPKKAINLIRRQRPRMNGDHRVRLFLARNGPIGNQPAKDLAPDGAARHFAGISFHNGDIAVTLVTKLIDGTFPDYTRVVPHISEEEAKSIVFRKADMLRAIDAITAGANERTRAVKLTFDPAGKLTVAMQWIDFGFAGSISFEAKTNVKEPFEIGYNGGYLRQAVEATAGEEVALSVADYSAPGRLVAPGSSDFLAVLMPMRI